MATETPMPHPVDAETAASLMSWLTDPDAMDWGEVEQADA